ncbi:uncharacterized protein B0I36DRAFT_248992 [Microdochium trichocladiopsis]|uniref:PLD phosphodiesterase domain-containing protein n=1 Tax=Microdochium trichocladiopsis TaxID=1682393 RepID=A0A9P9BQX8_9PEZI|nr:uncharacterized protein B0I36DRAFT_248992 [Microdochium trichocladiopsis]KAH7026337.1 hypothetical protein B0I36DRAFT_248992 [Microdochium trichocladiopsis]
MPHVRKDSGYAGPERVTKGLAISDSLAALCQSGESVSDLLAEDPSLTPGEAWKILLAKSKSSHIPQTQQASHASAATHDKASDNEERLSQDQLDVAFKCGQWGETRPSDLFLRMYHDALCSLNHDPAAGMASPSLLGTSGTVPLVVVSVIPDIVRHMSNLIVRAEKEVILATNFWQASTASRFITDAIREASRRAGQRGTRLTMKIIYDRGSPKQLLDSHYVVQEKEYTGKAVDLPAAHEIPHVDLEIRNIHLIPLGTFHSKFMVVDRKIGIVQSNNIQDNDNLEMMVHVEGPIVDGLYDMALLSWHKKLSPTLPMLSAGSCQAALSTPNGLAAEPSPDEFRHAGPLRFPKREAPYGIGADNIAEISSSTGATTTPANSRNASSHQQGLQQHPDADNLAVAQLQITTPGARDATRLAEHTHEDPHYDDDIAGEVARVQAAVSAKPGESQLEAVTRHLNHTVNKGFKGTPPPTSGATTGNHGNTDSIDDDGAMTPYILHPASQPFPIALVNRAPYGPPNHDSVSNPQNAAWLSALRNAKKNVFIQSPTLNAEPLVPAIIEACERGIDVYAYICLGYNDAGELLPMQGGHNEMVAAHLYGRLSTPEARKRLHYHWYTAKDQVAPIPAEKKKRSCHIKLMIVDESIAIVGSGNQDTQSWYHSQEVNIMLESESVCAAWIDGLRRNQNTHRYGALSQEDGIWRDAEGKQADGVMGVDPGKFSWLKGFTGAIKRVQGTGGF